MAKVNMAQLNEDPPPVNTGLMRWGTGVDGVTFYVNVHLDPGTAICKQCEGEGTLHFNAGYDGFERWEKCRCENCDGSGVVYAGEEGEQ
jgi:hypothetical protein